MLSPQPFSLTPLHSTPLHSHMEPQQPPPPHIRLGRASSSKRLDHASARALVSAVNGHFLHLLSDPARLSSLRVRLSSALSSPSNSNNRFPFSDHAVLSNLFWGAHHALSSPPRLAAAERLLQIPALLDETSTTAGIPNRLLVSSSYFYLAVVRRRQSDDVQVAMHFLHAVLVSPRDVRSDLAPELCRSIWSPDDNDELVRAHARRCKDWLMYYQVVSFGETPRWIKTSSALLVRTMRYGKGETDADMCNDQLVNKWPIIQCGVTLSQQEQHGPESKCWKKVKGGRRSIARLLEQTNCDDGYDGVYFEEGMGEFDIKRLQEMLEESQSDSSDSFCSQVGSEESDDEVEMENHECSVNSLSQNMVIPNCIVGERDSEEESPSSSRSYMDIKTASEAPRYSMRIEGCGFKTRYFLSGKPQHPVGDLKLSIVDMREVHPYPSYKYYVDYGTPPGLSPVQEFRCFGQLPSKLIRKYGFAELVPCGTFARRRLNFARIERDWSEENSTYENELQIEFMGKFEKAVSTLCFSESTGKSKDTGLEVMNMWEMLNHKSETKYSTLRQQILHQLLDILSNSKEEKFIKASVKILLLLVSEDKSLLDDIKRKTTHLHDLARALKTNAPEASILIYMVKPSPTEIKDLDLLSALVEVACNSSCKKWSSTSLVLSPTSASLSIIEILVSAFDHATNNMNLATISSPQVLSKLVNVARNKVLGEGIALMGILVKCMRFNGNCRKFISQVTPVDPFLHLLRSIENRAKCAALEYFHEILRMPRSSAIVLLHQIRKQGGTSILHTLMACLEQVHQEHKLLAANLLLQLDMLENSSGKSIFKEDALDVLIESISEDCASIQILSAFILSNLGGTYAWSGEPYTAAWLAKKAGLLSLQNRNMIRNIDWHDPCLQETNMDTWSSNIAKGLLKFGSSIFPSLAKGIESDIRSVAHDSLIATAWLGCEMATMTSNGLRYSACELLINGIVKFLHPGFELDERVLACLCIYNFASGKGVQKLMNFSEGVRESLRRLSSTTWMAEELLKVTDYFIPTKPRVSCVHTQILEAGKVGSGAATALIFYKGQLYGGYADGTIKIWDVKGQISKFIWEIKEHKKSITCFALYEPGDNLLSGSIDRTVRVWQLSQKKLQCLEIIEMKEPIHRISTSGDKIIMTTQSKGLKICHSSRIMKTICRGKHIKSFAVFQARAYIGCADSSVLEVDLTDSQEQEIRSPANIWRIHNKPINAIFVYKDSLYWADANVEESKIKDWRRHGKSHVSIPMERGSTVHEMAVVEDFIYLISSSSPSSLQIWLRGKQQKVGRLSVGGKVTSLLTANDIIFCGTETGIIKGWIPL